VIDMNNRNSLSDFLIAMFILALFCMWTYELTHKEKDENSQGCTVYYSLDGKESTEYCGIAQ